MSIQQPMSVVPLSPIARRPPQQYTSTILDSPPSSNVLLLPEHAHSHSSKPDIPPPPSPLPAFITSRIPPAYLSTINQNLGLLLVAFAQLFFALMNLSVKYFLSITHLSVLTLIAVRMVMTSLFCTIALLLLKNPNPFLGPPEIRKLLVLRGLFGFTGLAASYQSFRGLSVSDSLTIQYLAPALTGVLGWVLLGERLKPKEIGVGVACLLGVVLVSRPPFIFGSSAEEIIPGSDRPGMGRLPIPGGGDVGDNGRLRMISVAWALLSVVSSAAAYITIRTIGDRAHALHTMVYFSNLCSFCCLSALLILPGPIAWVTSTKDLLLIILIGIFGFCAQMLLTTGLQREKAGRAGLAMYLSVIFALVLEFIVFQTIPPFLSFLGTSIILASAYLVARDAFKTPVVDPESQPISRTPSPIPLPHSDRPPLRGEHYSYDSTTTPTKEIPNNISGGHLKIKSVGMGKRRSSTASNISGFTSIDGDS